MSTVFQVQGKQSLPVSHAQLTQERGIRRRLSSISLNLKIQSSSTYSKTTISSAGSSICRKWWEWGPWGWRWILSRKPSVATDLEMNDQEERSRNKGSWCHVFYKFTSQIRRKLLGSDNVGYDSFNYSGRLAHPLIESS